MPLAVSLVSTPRLRVHAVSLPLWRRLHRLALRMVTPLQTLWRTLLDDVRQAIVPGVLRETLRAPHRLETEQYLMGLWQREVEDEARMLVPVLLREVNVDTGALLHEEMQAVAGEPLTFLPDLPATMQERQLYVGQQVTRLATTTLLGLRHVLSAVHVSETSLEVKTMTVQESFGLTPVQLRSLTRARDQWEQDGRSVAAIQAGVQQAALLGLAQRVRTIAETQAFGAVNLSHRLAMTQAALASPFGVRGMRRYWRIAAGACAVCVQVPGMNAEGVPLESAFTTPNGPVMQPPLHPLCRCSADYR